MQGDTALSATARRLVLPHSDLDGEANILISDEEIERSLQEPGGRTLAEIWARLEKS